MLSSQRGTHIFLLLLLAVLTFTPGIVNAAADIPPDQPLPDPLSPAPVSTVGAQVEQAPAPLAPADQAAAGRIQTTQTPVEQPAEAPDPDRPIEVTYGFDRDFPPFTYEDADGEPVGFEIDLLRAVFKDTPVELSIQPMDWEKILVDLSGNTIQITSGMVRTEQRAKLYLFSEEPSFSLPICLFTKVDRRVPTVAALRGQFVSVDEGTYQMRLLQNFGGIKVVPYKGKAGGLKGLENNEVAAYCGLLQNTYYYINKLKYSAITTVGSPIGVTDMRFALNRDRKDVKALLDKGMAKVVENGEYDRLYRKWFVRDLDKNETDILVGEAKKATAAAYAPYAKQPQGAAVLTVTGRIYTAATVENKNPKLTVTALQGALSRAVSAGDMEIRAVVVVLPDGSIVTPALDEIHTLSEFGRSTLVLYSPRPDRVNQRIIPELLSLVKKQADN